MMIALEKVYLVREAKEKNKPLKRIRAAGTVFLIGKN